MCKFIFIIILILSFSFRLYAEPLLEKEIYYDADSTRSSGQKIYEYDAINNIKQIRLYSGNRQISKFIYRYEDNRIILCEEYASADTRVKYSRFTYQTDGRVVKKTEYNNNEEIMIVSLYIYDNSGRLVRLKEQLPDGSIMGERRFIYKDNKLSEEQQLDAQQKVLITKKYIYKNNLISQIDYYEESAVKLRTIKREYGEKSGKISVFGLKDNFYDYR